MDIFLRFFFTYMVQEKHFQDTEMRVVCLGEGINCRVSGKHRRDTGLCRILKDQNWYGGWGQ